MQRVLLIGASSFVGSHIALALREDYEVIGTHYSNRIRVNGIAPLRMALKNTDTVVDWVRVLQPDITIYCAAVVDDSKIQKDPLTALTVNTEAPIVLAEEMRRMDGKFIFLSTSKVFSGEGDGNYSELTEPSPTGAYGKSKRRAEEAFEMMTGAYILRLGTIYGLGTFQQSTSIIDRILRPLWAKERQRLIYDEYRSFFSGEQVGRAIRLVLSTSNDTSGIYHLAATEKDSYYSFAKALANCFGLPSETLVPIKGLEFSGKQAASGGPRGADLSLNGNKFCETFNVKWEELTESLYRLQEQLNAKRAPSWFVPQVARAT
jgi:dTDP-4-dehydrorhamnose reductase